uniref:Uncharacterized protein n=1 Tax=Oryza meridionalis TaxID=40149 RepID=A0A0E0DT36_9ORYZ
MMNCGLESTTHPSRISWRGDEQMKLGDAAAAGTALRVNCSVQEEPDPGTVLGRQCPLTPYARLLGDDAATTGVAIAQPNVSPVPSRPRPRYAATNLRCAPEMYMTILASTPTLQFAKI